MMTKPAATLLSVLTWVAMTSFCRGVTPIDLTHKLRTGQSITWPLNPEFNFTIMLRGKNPKYGIWIEGNKFSMPEHMGTHMDAPAHTAQGKLRLHQIPVERLMGPGVVVDVRHKVKDDVMYQTTVEDLMEWESEHGQMPEKAVVLVLTGWSSRYPDKKRVFNTDNIMDLNSFRFPSVSGEAARWLAEERHINALGVDVPSPDLARDDRLLVHEILLERNILILENVANLDQVPPAGATIVMGVLNIHDGSGAPMRLMAFSGGWRAARAEGLLSLGCVGLALLGAWLMAP